MTPLLQGLNKIYILAARQQQCVHHFYVRLPGSLGWWHLLLQANYGFLLLFWIPTIRRMIILLLLGFMAKTLEFFSKTWLQHTNTVPKKLYHLQVSTCCLITDTSLHKTIVQMPLSIKTWNFDTNIFGVTFKIRSM